MARIDGRRNGEDEDAVVWEGGPAKRSFLPHVAFLVVLLAGLPAVGVPRPWASFSAALIAGGALLGLLGGGVFVYYGSKSTYAVGTEAIRARTVRVGRLRVDATTRRLRWDDVEAVETGRGAFGRFLGYGHVYYRGDGRDVVQFYGVPDPEAVPGRPAEGNATR